MKKKVLAFALVCVMLFSMVPFSAFAAEAACPGKGHTHSKALCTEGTYTEVEVVPSLCGEWGYTLYQCNVCGEYFADDLNRVEGNHDWQVTAPAVAATCTVAGKTAVETCTKCGTERGGETIPPLNHKNKVEVSNTGFTCEEKGKITYYCPDCGETIVEEIPGTGEGHDWDEKTVEIKVEPTWNTKGVAVYHCSNCDAVKEYDIAPLGHTCTDSLVKTEAKAPTCLAAGNIEYYTCSVCGKLYKNADATDEVALADTVVAKLANCAVETLVKTEAKGASCTADGNIEYYTCSVCGKTYTDAAATTAIELKDTVVPALGHDTEGVTPEESVAATCTTDGWAKVKCKRCGEVIVEVLKTTGHTYDTVPLKIEPTCTTFGFDIYACTVCGETKDTNPIAPLGHTAYDDATSTDKTEVPATCTKDGSRTWKCGRCGKAMSETLKKLGHDTVTVNVAATCAQYDYTFTYCTRETCPEAAVEYFVEAAVKYSVKVDGKAVHLLDKTVGSTLDPENHNLIPETINMPTCTTDGNMIGYCEYCTAYITETLPALGHDFTWTEADIGTRVTVLVDQSCTTDQKVEVTCSRCSAIEEQTTDKKATGHDFTWTEADIGTRVTVVVEQTCTTDQKVKVTCSRCTATKEQTTDKKATGHDYDGVKGVVVPPTCQADGYTGYTCKNCGYVDKRDIVKYAYQNEYTLEAAQTAHPGLSATGEEIRKGNCKVVGLYKYLCSDCGLYVFVSVDGTGSGHVPPASLPEKTDGALEFAGKDPTCTEAGYKEQYICTVCGELVVSEVIPALGHDWDKTAGKDATCTDDGYKAKWVCKTCGVTDTENDGSVIPALGHDYEDFAEVPATCYEDGVSAYKVCKRCGEVVGKAVIPAKNHSNSKVVAERIAANCLDFSCTLMRCEDCGYEYVTDYSKVGAHTYVTTTTDPTCDKEGKIEHVCSLCGDKYSESIPATGHNYEQTGHVDPSCEVAGTTTYTCTKCGGTKVDVIPPTGHHNAAGETIVDDCLDPVTDRTCKDCGAVIGKTHNFITNVNVPATCKEYGYTLEVCTACGYNKVTSVDESYLAGHTYGDWVVTTAPTITSKGVETRTCSVCGDKQTRDVDPLPGILYSFEIVNANGVDKSGISDSSLIAVKVKLNSAKVNVWGLELNVKYDDEKFDFVGSDFLSKNFITAPMAIDNGGYVSILASAPNTDEGKTQNVTIEGEEDLVVLYFRVTCSENATATFSFGTMNAIQNDATVIGGSGTDAEVQIQKFLDVNGDGDINIADALAAYKMVTGESKVAYDVRVDVDKDGKITLADFVALYQYIAGARTYEEMTKSSAE